MLRSKRGNYIEFCYAGSNYIHMEGKEYEELSQEEITYKKWKLIRLSRLLSQMNLENYHMHLVKPQWKPPHHACNGISNFNMVG